MNIRWTTCQGCGKRTYETRRDAKKAARDYLPAHHISAYTACSGIGWHAGHLPARVLVGDTTRTDYYQGEVA